MLGVMYGVVLWAEMNAATPLGARGCSVIAVATFPQRTHDLFAHERHGKSQCLYHTVPLSYSAFIIQCTAPNRHVHLRKPRVKGARVHVVFSF